MIPAVMPPHLVRPSMVVTHAVYGVWVQYLATYSQHRKLPPIALLSWLVLLITLQTFREIFPGKAETGKASFVSSRKVLNFFLL